MSAAVMPLQTFETPIFTIHNDDDVEHETASPSSSPLFSKKIVVPASTATITPLHTSPSTTQFSQTQHSLSSSSSTTTATPIISPSSIRTTPNVAIETDIDEDIDTPDINDNNDRDADDDDLDGALQRKRSESNTADEQSIPHTQREEVKGKTRRPRKLSSTSSNRRTVAILDWDDTLLPSSWLRKQGHLQSFAYALHQYQQQLQQLQQQQQQQQTDNSSTSTSTPSPSLPTLPTLPPIIASQLTSLSSAVVSLVRDLMDKNNNNTDSKKESQRDDEDEESDEDEDSVSRVVIVTNAEQGWVELTARSFLPELLPYLDIPSTNNSASTTIATPPSSPSPTSASSSSSSSRRQKTQKKISIISARSSFEQQFPGAPLTWKMRAFEKVLGEAIGAFNAETTQLSEQGALSTSTSRVLNVLSIGDSIIEREAARRVVACTSSTHSVVLCKSVKLAERTSCEKLCRQLQLMTHALNYVRSHAESLDLQMTITDDTEGKLPPTASMQKANLDSASTSSSTTTPTDTNTTSSSTSTTTPSKSPRHNKEIEEVKPPKKAKWWRRVLSCGAPVYD